MSRAQNSPLALSKFEHINNFSSSWNHQKTIGETVNPRSQSYQKQIGDQKVENQVFVEKLKGKPTSGRNTAEFRPVMNIIRPGWE